MQISLTAESEFALRSISAGNGLCIKALPNGCVYSIECGEVLINQVLASPAVGGVARVYLRVWHDRGIRFIEMVGPGASSDFASTSDRLIWSGSWLGLDYRCTWWLHPTGRNWFNRVEVQNKTDEAVRCDAVMVQDIGLATRGFVRNNEAFVSQYLDHSVLENAEAGFLLMTRQNL